MCEMVRRGITFCSNNRLVSIEGSDGCLKRVLENATRNETRDFLIARTIVKEEGGINEQK